MCCRAVTLERSCIEMIFLLQVEADEFLSPWLSSGFSSASSEVFECVRETWPAEWL